MERYFNIAGPCFPDELSGYLDTLGLPEGWMAVFDDDKAKSWDEKIYTRDEVFNGKTIHVIGLAWSRVTVAARGRTI